MSTETEYWRLAEVYIAGIDRVGELLRAGRTEDARDHFISCARAVWQNRWRSARHYSLARLGAALDGERYPQLAPVITALLAEDPAGASQFLAYLRARTTPDLTPYRCRPDPPPAAFDAAHVPSSRLWQAARATGDPQLEAALRARVQQFLDPVRVISWHETSWPYLQLVASALHEGGLDDATLCYLILFGLDHAEQCNATSHLSDPPQTSIGGNHLFAWITGWLSFTTLFPEFRRCPALQAAAIARLDDELSLQVMPDGSMIEGAPGYQNCCLYGASWFLRFCRTHGVELPRRVHAAWERMLRFVIGLQRPDGRIPMLGDSQDCQTRGYVWALPGFYDLPELKWTVSNRQEGRPPAFTSVAFPCIGYYVQRSGWGAEDRWLCFDGGRFGQAHQHEDLLHFELYAYGREFLVDAGVHSYSDHWFRQWAVLAQAHNTVTVDGAGECRWREDRTRWFGPTPLPNRWTTGETWDLAEATFTGPWERDVGPVSVHRRVLFHRGAPTFWWITDTVSGPGRHEITELFHFAHDLTELDDLPGGVGTKVPDGPNLALLALTAKGDDAAPPLVLTRHRGEQDPPRGWTSPTLNTVEPAWELHFTTTTELPLRRDFLLLPVPGSLPAVTARLDPTRRELDLQLGAAHQGIPLPEW